jgi:hypothetical protein
VGHAIDARASKRCRRCSALQPNLAQRAPGSCFDSRPAGGRTRSIPMGLGLRCAGGRTIMDLSGGDTPWPAGRTRVAVQSGYTADRVWGSRFLRPARPGTGPGPLPSSASSAADGLYPSPRTPLLITAHRSLGTIRRDQDSAARNAPRCAHWSPGRLSPRGLDALAPPCAGGELRAATTERTSSRGRFRHAFHAHALRARCGSVLRT